MALAVIAALVLGGLVGFRAGMAKCMPCVNMLDELLKIKEVRAMERVQKAACKWFPRGGVIRRGRFIRGDWNKG